MSKMLLAAALAASTLVFAAPASAAVVLSFTGGAQSPTSGYTVVDDFSSLAGLTNIIGDVQIKSGAADGNGAPPANVTPLGNPYLSVLAGGSATYNFAAPVSAFQFDWGSIDTYNSLTINASDGSIVVVPGGSLFPNAANGDQIAAGTNGLFQVSSNSGQTFNSITFASSGNSFELDNLAVAPVPEPATWAMMILGLGGIGAGLRRRRSFGALQTA
jgi:hypothetical protein